MKIIFLDFDGVMIPTRAYWLPNQTRPVTLFDPCAVSMLNKLCEESGAKIVLVTSWRKTIMHDKENLVDHCVEQGIDRNHFHDDHSCPFKFTSNKYHDLGLWLDDHPEVTDYVVLDDDLYDADGTSHTGHLITPSFDDGLTFTVFLAALKILAPEKRSKYKLLAA